MWNPPKKDTPWIMAKEKPHQDSRRGAITFNIKPHTCQDAWRAQTKSCVTRTQGKERWLSQQTEPALPLGVWGSPSETWVSSGLPWGQGSSRPGRCGMWPKSSQRRSPLAPPYNFCVGDPQTGEQLYQRNSCSVEKVLGATTDFLTSGSSKEA